MKRPVILTDCDGVLLNWSSKFYDFLKDKQLPHNHLKNAFNNNNHISIKEMFPENTNDEAMRHLLDYHASHYLKELDVLENDSIQVIKKLSKNHDIVVVTSLSHERQAYDNRKENLELHYGNSITDLICLPFGADKRKKLEELNNKHNVKLWLDDSVHHVKSGLDVGINSYQYSYGMNGNRNTSEVPEINSWKKTLSMMNKNKNKIK